MDQVAEQNVDFLADLLASSLLMVTKNFNSIVTQGKSREEDFPKEQLPSLLFPEFTQMIDAVPLMFERFFSTQGKYIEEDAIVYLRIISIIAGSHAMGLTHDMRSRLSFSMIGLADYERDTVKQITNSTWIKDLGVPFKLVTSSFSPYPRPKAADIKNDLRLQIGVRMFLYVSARWHGADQKSAERIFDQHLKVSWALVMCGMWQEALKEMDNPHRRRF